MAANGLGPLVESVEFRVHSRAARGLGIFIVVVLGVSAALVLAGLATSSRGLRNGGFVLASIVPLAGLFWLIAVAGRRLNIAAIDVHDGGLRVRYRAREEIIPWADITNTSTFAYGAGLLRDQFETIQVRGRKRPLQLSHLHQGDDEVTRVITHVHKLRHGERPTRRDPSTICANCGMSPPTPDAADGLCKRCRALAR